MGTAIVLAILILLAGGAVFRIVQNHKTGKGTCSCGCGGCAMSEICHSDKKKSEEK